MKVLNAAITDVGKKRQINEDNFFISKEEGLFVLADGMGGHQAGDMASKIAVDTIGDFIRATSRDKEITWPYDRDGNLPYEANRLIVAIKLANKKIFNTAREKNLDGMGTTIASLIYKEEKVYLCHVGDSRIYRVRDGKIKQLTSDHSLLNDSLKAKSLTQEEIDNFPFKNVITRALGIEDNVDVEMDNKMAKQGDYYLVCSDGLSNLVPDDDIKEVITKHKDKLIAACKELIQRANDAGGNDNITCILVHLS
ncbi:MAG: Stp1/IreP family PP2C-type Ser/Thr phosphatase [Pseudomonadota bacterium]